MSLKDVFNTIKKESYVTGPLDMYLIKKSSESNDRAINVNAPSQAGNCNRANFYARMQYEVDESINPRTQRIFDNGTYTHMRLQSYLMDMFLLIQDEVPLINDEYHIQGHTDGYLDLGDEIAILEIKSIKDSQFTQLKDAKPEHKKQGLVYLYCTEERRKFLHRTYKNREEFNASKETRKRYFSFHYQHLVDGSKYSREDKINNEVKLNMISDDILFDTNKPITKVIFLYENKDSQELKEFLVERNISTEPILKEVLDKYKELNLCCSNNTPPEREASSKSECRWCDYKNTCWVL